MSQCPGHSHAGDRSASSAVLVSGIHSKLRHAQFSWTGMYVLHAPYTCHDCNFKTNIDAN